MLDSTEAIVLLREIRDTLNKQQAYLEERDKGYISAMARDTKWRPFWPKMVTLIFIALGSIAFYLFNLTTK